ncbi:MAG: hypothetical protein N3D11_00870 [Candidatus Sumerlaeia bacterium]|nr:hypothetical protein [Candidatus Sumerlaeia bacterium]
MKRGWGLLLAAGVLLGSSGCARYLENRLRDAGEIIDLGITVSPEPNFAAFVIFPPIHLTAVGYGMVDGWFAGLGGGKLQGFCPYFEQSAGLLVWGYETVSFGKRYADLAEFIEKGKDDELAKQCTFYRTGALGLAEGPPWPPDDYRVSCPHYLHLGFVGAVLSPRYSEIADLLTGFFLLDLSGDDLPMFSDTKELPPASSKTK